MLSIRSVFRDISLTLLFVFVTFCPSIRFLPYYTWVLALLGVLVLSKKSFASKIAFWRTNNRHFLHYMVIVIIYNSLLVPYTHSFGDFTYIPLQIGVILSMLRSTLLLYCLDKFGSGNILSQYSKYFFYACIIYVLFTVSFIIYPSFKNFWLYTVLTDVNDRSADFSVYQFRYSLDGFAAFSSASIFSFACLFSCYLIAIYPKVSVRRIACLMLMVVGCFFYGRISLVGMLLGACLIVLENRNFVKTIKIAGIIVAFVLGILTLLNTFTNTNSDLLMWQEWAFSIVKQLFVDKVVTDYSVTHMFEDMYYMPDWNTLIFGDGGYTNSNGSYYGHTDVGFMRLILYGGLISLILVYSIIIKLSKKIIQTTESKNFKRFIFLSTILFFVLEMKGESYQRAIMMLYPLFLIQNYINNTPISNHE